MTRKGSIYSMLSYVMANSGVLTMTEMSDEHSKRVLSLSH